ncbi:MAG: hypothetical protein ABFR05_04275 [Bacteroidota bacterium]
MKKTFFTFCLLIISSINAQTYVDKPFTQDYAEKFTLSDDLKDSQLFQVRSDRNKVVNILSSKGLLFPYDTKLANDLRYRPLTDMKIIAISTFKDQFVYLTDKAVLSNAFAGKFYFEHKMKNPLRFIVAEDFTTLIASENELVLFEKKERVWNRTIPNLKPQDIIYDKDGQRFLILGTDGVYQLKYPENEFSKVFDQSGFTAFTIFDNKIIIGTGDGIINLDKKTFKLISENKKLPCTQITTLKNIDNSLWFGSKKGAFKLRKDGKYDYYSSKRWLVDDEVIDIEKGSDNSVVILTKTGLSKINFVQMTLAEKAEYFQEIQRLRHVRYGFTSETRLLVPGDLSTTTLRDTDNDGLWTSMYLAGELFRYAVTKSEDAKQNAYEAFEAMERLTEISGIDGFPARTYELDGYQSSDTDPNMPEEKKIWRLADKEDPRWRWKSTTSSDESCGHFFVYALFADLAPDKEWRDRAIHQIKIEMDHIIDNDWYLVTWNGKPTEWGRWNPDYVNSFPINVGDRRLNSTLILAFLQTTYHYTGDKKYKKEAEKLIKKYGYDENANRPASVIGFEEGEELSNKWNHSDDEMYFLTAPAFVNYSFTEEQKQKHFEAVRSHWEIERNEKNPLWNYLFALVGGKNIDVEDSAWWLREFPMDLIDWKVDNTLRKDLVRIESNFRSQEFTEVLPQDERVLHLHNGAYRNSGGSDGKREYPPYIYLLPYWAGRYVDAISTP